MEVTESIVESEVWTELDNILERWAEFYIVKNVDLETNKVWVEFTEDVETDEIDEILKEHEVSFIFNEDYASMILDVIIDHEHEYIGIVKH